MAQQPKAMVRRSRRVAMESWHPAASLAFFAAALVLTVVVQNPSFLAAAFCAAFGLLLTVCGVRAWRTFGALLPLFAVVALANPLVNSQGATVLFVLPWGRPYTLEALLFGAQTAAMLVTVLLWFSSFNAVMTGDRLGRLFGSAVPGTSLVLTMVLRLVPRFGRQARKVALAFDGLAGTTMRQDEDETPDGGRGAQKRPAAWRGRVRRGARELSALASWALEGSIDTADSMRSRGYGTGQRSRLAAYRVTPAQGLGCLLEGCLLVVAMAAIACGRASVQLIPVVSLPPADGFFFAGLLSFTLFLALPALVNAVERLRWNFSLSRI